MEFCFSRKISTLRVRKIQSLFYYVWHHQSNGAFAAAKPRKALWNPKRAYYFSAGRAAVSIELENYLAWRNLSAKFFAEKYPYAYLPLEPPFFVWHFKKICWTQDDLFFSSLLRFACKSLKSQERCFSFHLKHLSRKRATLNLYHIFRAFLTIFNFISNKKLILNMFLLKKILTNKTSSC